MERSSDYIRLGRKVWHAARVKANCERVVLTLLRNRNEH